MVIKSLRQRAWLLYALGMGLFSFFAVTMEGRERIISATVLPVIDDLASSAAVDFETKRAWRIAQSGRLDTTFGCNVPWPIARRGKVGRTRPSPSIHYSRFSPHTVTARIDSLYPSQVSSVEGWRAPDLSPLPPRG